MFVWGVVVFIGLWLILRDVNPVKKAKLMGTSTAAGVHDLQSGPSRRCGGVVRHLQFPRDTHGTHDHNFRRHVAINQSTC